MTYEDQVKELCEMVMNAWGNETAGVNNRETLRQAKNKAAEIKEGLALKGAAGNGNNIESLVKI